MRPVRTALRIRQARRRRTARRALLSLIAITALGGLALHLKSSQSPATVTISLTSSPSAPASPAPAPTPTPAPTPADPGPALQAAWKQVLDGRQGRVEVALYDRATGKTARYATKDGAFNTASIVKLSILEATLLQAQEKGQPLTAAQLAKAAPMIERSDNDAATSLWNALGGTSAMNAFFKRLGMASTSAGRAYYWGLTQTTATDQLKVLNALAYPGDILSAGSAATAAGLLDKVEADQRWGVSGGLPAGVTVRLKNGWLPDNQTNDAYAATSSWTVNSIGHVSGNGADYTMAVLTEGDPGEQYGIDTIELLSAASWRVLEAK